MLGGAWRRIQDFRKHLRSKALQQQLTNKSPYYCCKALHFSYLWESWICLQTLFCYLNEYHQIRILRVGFFFGMSPITSNHQSCSMKRVFLQISQNSQESTCARVSFLIKLQGQNKHFLPPDTHVYMCVSGSRKCDLCTHNFIKKETLAQVFSYEFCEIFRNISFTEHLRETASVLKTACYSK